MYCEKPIFPMLKNKQPHRKQHAHRFHDRYLLRPDLDTFLSRPISLQRVRFNFEALHVTVRSRRKLEARATLTKQASMLCACRPQVDNETVGGRHAAGGAIAARTSVDEPHGERYAGEGRCFREDARLREDGSQRRDAAADKCRMSAGRMTIDPGHCWSPYLLWVLENPGSQGLQVRVLHGPQIKWAGLVSDRTGRKRMVA